MSDFKFNRANSSAANRKSIYLAMSDCFPIIGVFRSSWSTSLNTFNNFSSIISISMNNTLLTSITFRWNCVKFGFKPKIRNGLKTVWAVALHQTTVSFRGQSQGWTTSFPENLSRVRKSSNQDKSADSGAS